MARALAAPAVVLVLAGGFYLISPQPAHRRAGGGAGGLRIYMTAGVPSSDGDVKDFVELAPLKGTKGNQQYRLPRSLDLERYRTVVIWCVPFTTRIAQAVLR
ncbi:MAG TPA: DM13 domain-containing protein [Thermoleophilaceae bacterium]|nr:DM13 domain-containing protein [Thermoleophilaceae bacterium]